MILEQRLSEWQRSKLCEVILLGCDRTTACDYIGADLAQLEQEIERDESYGRAVAKAEAEAAMRHMGNVHKAATDEKNWRTSVWWLDRRAQERSSHESLGPNDAHVAELVDELAKIIVAVIIDAEVQRRLIERLLHVVSGAHDPEALGAAEPALLAGPVPPPPSSTSIASAAEGAA